MRLRAQVRNGRLELSEPTNLPEGEIVELAQVESHDPALERALDTGLDDLRAGRVRSAQAVMAKLHAR